MDSREEFPRVSVGSVQDWQRLKATYKNAALASMEAAIASHGLDREERAVVLAHANQNIDASMQMAQRNLRINGQNYESLDLDEQNTEPFDEALDRRIWSLADTRLQWQKRIAETRRTLPQEIETSVLDLLDQHRGTDGDETTAFKDNMVDTADTEIEDYGDVLARYSQMEEVLQRTLALGEELDQTTTSQEERVERVRTVTDEVKSLKV